MAVRFIEKNHSYKSIDPQEKIDWISVTTLVSALKHPFDPIAQSEKSSKNARSKWYKMNPADIRAVWEDEGKRANTLGDWYHKQREADITGIDSIVREGLELPIIKPIFDGIEKLAPAQNLTPGIYPEHFIYLKSSGICGQSDRVEIIGPYIDIIDYKTNKEIKLRGYKRFDGSYQMMTGPVSHLEDCELNHYALQLSIYMYIIQKHNHNLKPRNMTLQHITFEEEGKNKFGYPIAKMDHNGEPIVKEVVSYKVPYFKREVQSILNWLPDNRDKIRKKL